MLATAAILLSSPIAHAVAAEARPVEPASIIRVTEREKLALLVTAPSGTMKSTNRSDIYRQVSELLRDTTDFEIEPVENPFLLRECQGRIGCLALGAQSDPRGGRRPKYLVVLSIRASAGDTERLLAVLVDMKRVAELRRGAPEKSVDLWDEHRSDAAPIDEKGSEAFEDRVFRSAVRAQSSPSRIASSADFEAALRKILLVEFRDAFIGSQDWIQYGAIELRTEVEGAAVVQLDGDAIGSIGGAGGQGGGLARIVGLKPGAHRISVLHPDYLPFSAEVSIRAGETATLSAGLAKKPRPEVAAGRAITLWGGVASVAIGAAITSAAILKASHPGAAALCIEASAGNSGCGGAPFVRSAEPGREDALGGGASSRGVSLAPLGYSLALAGGAWSVATLLGDEHRFPWLEIALGLGIGAASFALSVALEPR